MSEINMSDSDQISAPATQSPAIIAALVQALDAKKADNLRVLKVAEQSSITDYLIMGTGMAGPHLRALRVELEKVLDTAGAPIAGVDFGEDSGWIVFDAYQVMVHLFLPEQRELYQLEKLWGDAEELDVESMLVVDPKRGAPVIN